MKSNLSTLLLGTLWLSLAMAANGQTGPRIQEFQVPSTLHHLKAEVVPIKSNEDVLRKIGAGFADAYKFSSTSYSFTSPDRVELHARYSGFTGTQIYTNLTRHTDIGFIHKTDDISGDITRRKTIFDLGLLPQNYLETMRQTYVGTETLDGIPCQVYILRYITDLPDDKRRFQVWVSIEKHYVVKKRVWNGGNEEHETIKYKNPIQVLPGVWVPTVAEAYDPQGELGGVAEQRNISAD